MSKNRIISLVPSQTELLWYLGAGERVVGITKFCIHPTEWHQTKTKIGGTKTLNIQKIQALQPDLIIANKEENTKSEVELLAAQYPTYISDIVTWQDALDMILCVGELVGCGERAAELVAALEICRKDFQQHHPTRRAAYLIWREPYMVAAGETYINEMLDLAGFCNVFADQSRYPIITTDTLQAAQPDYILLSSEPYPFSEKHIAELQQICPQAQVRLVDGELFSWYGNRMLQSFDYFKTL